MGFNKTPFDTWPPLKVLLCKQHYNYPPALSSDNKTFSKSFYNFVQACCHKSPKLRTSAIELLDHPFLKQAKNNICLENSLVKNKDMTIVHSEDNHSLKSKPQSPTRDREFSI